MRRESRLSEAPPVEEFEQRYGDAAGRVERLACLAHGERLRQGTQRGRRVLDTARQQNHAVGDAYQGAGSHGRAQLSWSKSELGQLKQGGTVRGAYIGLTSLTIDSSLSALNLPVKSGALVQSVQKGTPAEKAGIRGGNVDGSIENGQVAVGGDIIVSIDGKAVHSSEDLASDISAKHPGDKITVGLYRGTGSGHYERKTLTVTLASRPNTVPNANIPE